MFSLVWDLTCDFAEVFGELKKERDLARVFKGRGVAAVSVLSSGPLSFGIGFAEFFEFGGCGCLLGGAAGRFAVGAGFGFAATLAAWFFARNGLETGPAGIGVSSLFRGSHVLLEADCCTFVESLWRFDGGRLHDF